MRYMLLLHHGANADLPPMSEWDPADAQAHGAAMMDLYRELTERGELVSTEGLTGPEAAKIVVSDGNGAPVVTDGPFAESKELLAGYWLVDVESEERAVEIAARTSAAPGPGGRPTAREIHVRPVMDRPRP